MKVVDRLDLTNFSSMRIKAFCERAFFPESVDDVKEVICEARRKKKILRILGGGTNTLFGRSWIEGYVLIMVDFRDIRIDGNNIHVSSGFPLPELLRKTTSLGLSGLEPLFGIPGTVGGAVCGNAGSRRGSIGDVVERVHMVDWGGNEIVLGKEDIDFSYRNSSLKGRGVITYIDIALSKKKKEKIEEFLEKAKDLRKNQPMNLPTLGCIFKNPPEMPAGRLLDELGLKGFRIGDAFFSEKHANFIVNGGNASPVDIIQLIRIAKESASKVGIHLEEEVDIWE